MDGWASTGAATGAPAIIASAIPPVKHMPTAPTPGPPSSACSVRARARSQSAIGAVWLEAELGELAPDAEPGKGRKSIRNGDRGAGLAEQAGQHHREPRGDDLGGEGQHGGRDAGDLVHDHHAGAGALAVDRERPAAVAEVRQRPGGKVGHQGSRSVGNLPIVTHQPPGPADDPHLPRVGQDLGFRDRPGLAGLVPARQGRARRPSTCCSTTRAGTPAWPGLASRPARRR